jgi:glycine cleavage system H lipoate-binding protein
MAHPGTGEDVYGIPLPGWLQYSANHMWLDVTDDGTCHAGIDGFLSRVLGKVDRISYVRLSGRQRPSAVLTIGGTDLEVVFPNPFLVTKCNLYLRADPTPLTADPYTAGWLFEGVPDPGTTNDLYRGPAAREWMEEEERRMNQSLQEHAEMQACRSCDGGLFAEGVARKLDRDQMLSLFHEFFSPYASGK